MNTKIYTQRFDKENHIDRSKTAQKLAHSDKYTIHNIRRDLFTGRKEKDDKIPNTKNWNQISYWQNI